MQRVKDGYKASRSARLLSATKRFFNTYTKKIIEPMIHQLYCHPPKLPKKLPKDLTELQVDTLLESPSIGPTRVT